MSLVNKMFESFMTFEIIDELIFFKKREREYNGKTTGHRTIIIKRILMTLKGISNTSPQIGPGIHPHKMMRKPAI